MMKDIIKSKKQETEDIIKDLKNKESLERAKMRLDCLSVFDDFENFAFYYELLMSNEKEYVKTKSWELLKRKNELQFERYRNEKALETASEEETKKLNIRIRAVHREIGILSKRIAFLNGATFAVLNSPNGTQKLQSAALKISELRKKLDDVRTRVVLPYGYFPYLNTKLYEVVSFENGTALLNQEELSKLSRAVSKSENEYFKALVNLKYFDEERLSYLISLDSTDFKEIRRLVSEYKEFIGEDLQLAYVKSYRSYIDKSGKLFANKKESREAERRLSFLAQMILISIRQNLTKIYEEIEAKFGYHKSIVPLSLEGIFELKGALRQRTDEAYEYLTEVKTEVESAKSRIALMKENLQDEINCSYQNLSDISGVTITEEIVPVKISEYVSIYKKVYSKRVLKEINQAVEEELVKHNVTQKGGTPLTKANQHKED